MNETEVLCAAEIWVKDYLTCVESHSAHISEHCLHIKLFGKKGIRTVSIKSEVKLFRAILNKAINHIPIFFAFNGEAEPNVKLFEDFKKTAIADNSILLHLENYFTPFSHDGLRVKFEITARLILKIDLRNFPEGKAFKHATTLLKDFNSVHPALEPFPEIQITYCSAGTRMNEWLRRKKAA